MTKKHVVLIVGLVLIAAIALINGLLFRVKTVTVDFDTETSIQAEEGEAEKIIAASGIKKGKNIFGVSESRMIKNINAALPGVRVVNIERIFPNRIVIHVSKRVPVYLMKYRQNTSDAAKYVVVGRYGGARLLRRQTGRAVFRFRRRVRTCREIYHRNGKDVARRIRKVDLLSAKRSGGDV